MMEAKSIALPLGDIPTFNGVDEGTRTLDNQNHNLALYQLNYVHHMVGHRRLELRTP